MACGLPAREGTTENAPTPHTPSPPRPHPSGRGGEGRERAEEKNHREKVNCFVFTTVSLQCSREIRRASLPVLRKGLQCAPLPPPGSTLSQVLLWLP